MNDSHRSYDSYDDGLVQLDRAAITLRRYHFPSGTSKVIALGSIRGYKAESLGLFTQRLESGAAPISAAGFPWTSDGRCGRR